MIDWFRPKIQNVITNTYEEVDIYRTVNQQFTVKELIDVLNDIVQKNPSTLNAPVSHIDFGSETYSTNVEVDKNGVIIRHRIVNSLKPIRLPIRLFRCN